MRQRPETDHPVTHRQILGGLRVLGIQVGDLLLVHSSLSSLGYVDGGADTVVQVLMETVSPAGSVFVPTFNYGKLPFDPDRTPSLAGAVTESFRNRSGALRSRHPTHSLAGLGPRAQEILVDHHAVRPFGRGSPLWRLWECNAKVLLIGCNHRSNSMLHVAEEVADVPYLNRTRQAQVIEEGTQLTVMVHRPGCSRSFNRVESLLSGRSIVTEGRIGHARVLLMNAKPLVALVAERLRVEPTLLLCDTGSCVTCDESRRLIVEHRGSFHDR